MSKASSLQVRLIRMQLLNVLVVILFISTVAVYYIVNEVSSLYEKQINATVKIVAHNLKTPMMFNDNDEIQNTLSVLNADPNFLGAVLEKKSGEKITYLEDFRGDGKVNQINEQDFIFSEKIKALNDELGTLYIKYTKKYLHDIYLSIAMFTFAVFVFAVGISVLLARFFQKDVTGPINSLLKFISKITAHSEWQNIANIPISSSEISEILNLKIEFKKMVEVIKKREEETTSAKNAAEKANEAKSEFLSNMSHELRTPMNAVLGYTQLLRRSFHKKGILDYQKDLGEIEKAGKHLLSLINDVLDIAKIESGKVELYVENFNLEKEVEEIVSLIKPFAASKNNQMSVEIEKSLTEMTSDVTKFKQVLLNLINNACKFTENGTVALKILPEVINGLPAVRISVSDTGIGITAEQIAKLFNPFTQADTSTTRKYGGTGLGLHISKNFVELMGGKIFVESELGKGATFTMILPLSLDHHLKNKIENKGSSKDDLQKFKILIIDDEAFVHDLFTKNLEEFRVEILSAYNAKEGIESTRKNKPDLILLDITLPDLSGWDVMSILKSDKELAGIPIIISTTTEEKNKAYTIGAADFLQKPVDNERFLRLLLNYRCKNPPCLALVVDDNENNRKVMERSLVQESWNVKTVDSGAEALEFLKSNKPEIIFLDLMMPDMDGFEVLDKIKSHEAWLDIPVIIVTAKDLTEEDKKRLNNKMESILTKENFSSEKAKHEILRILGKSKVKESL
ncbi:MAG: response regulator [Bdellovibrionota bacterium]